MESVIHSDVFREELQEMVAKQISESLQPASQPLYDLISLRQRYGQPDENRKYGTWLLLVRFHPKVLRHYFRSYALLMTLIMYTVCQKNETRIILNILYSCKSIAMKFSSWCPDDTLCTASHVAVLTLPQPCSISAAFLPYSAWEPHSSVVLPFDLYRLSMAYNVSVATSCIICKIKRVCCVTQPLV